MSKKPHNKVSTVPSTSHSAPRDNRINLSATQNTNRVIVNVKWQPLKKYLESNNEKTLICRSTTSVSEEGNEEPPGSDDSHATVVQSVTEENERSPSSAGSKKSENGNDNNEENEGKTEEEERQEEDEGINDGNNEECTSDTKEDVIVVEDIEDNPEEVADEEEEEEKEELSALPEPEEIEEMEEPSLEPEPVHEEEELPPPPPQFTSLTEVTSAPPTRETSDSAKTITIDNDNTTTTIDIEKIEPFTNNCKENDTDLEKELTTTKITKLNAPSTSSVPTTSNNNDSQIITVPIINEPDMSTKQDSPQKIQEKKPLPDISNNR